VQTTSLDADAFPVGNSQLRIVFTDAASNCAFWADVGTEDAVPAQCEADRLRAEADQSTCSTLLRDCGARADQAIQRDAGAVERALAARRIAAPPGSPVDETPPSVVSEMKADTPSAGTTLDRLTTDWELLTSAPS
jgi:hypothetical protein